MSLISSSVIVLQFEAQFVLLASSVLSRESQFIPLIVLPCESNCVPYFVSCHVSPIISLN